MEFLVNNPIYDISEELHLAIEQGKSSLKKFRKHYNGDGTIEYKYCNTSITIQSKVLLLLHSMMERAGEDNLERPFFIIFDEESLCCLDVIEGAAGDEGYCPHTAELVDESYTRCSSLQLSHTTPLLLSRGHTHPVFFEDGATTGCSSFGGLYLFGQSDESPIYGALPSNIFGRLPDWQARMAAADKEPGSRNRSEAIREGVILPRAYKHNCEDYIESYLASHALGFNGSSAGHALGSCFHWIITPRLRQIGVFETPKDQYGVVIYHPWRVGE